MPNNFPIFTITIRAVNFRISAEGVKFMYAKINPPEHCTAFKEIFKCV